MALFSPAKIGETYAAVRSVQDSVALPAEANPSLLALARKVDNRKQIIAAVALNIIALDQFLQLTHRLTDDQVDYIAEEVVNSYGGAITFADVNIVMRRAKSGAYGRFYERLSAPDVIGWFRDYFDERLNAAEAHSHNEDKKRYGIAAGKGREVLEMLGYEFDEKGHWVGVHAVEPKKEKTESEKEAEYRRYKAELYANQLKNQQQ